MKSRITATTLIGILGITGVAQAETLRVPSAEHPDLAAALATAGPGDRIRLGDGVHALPPGVHDVPGVSIEGPRRFRPVPFGPHGRNRSICPAHFERAVLIGDGTLRGDGIQIRGVTIKHGRTESDEYLDGKVTIEGDDVRVSRSNLQWGAMVIEGQDARVANVIVDRASTMTIEGDRARLRSVWVRVGHLEAEAALTLRGDAHDVQRCRFEEQDSALLVEGDSLTLRRNRFRDSGWSARIVGHSARVESNRFTDVDAVASVTGDGAVVTGNRANRVAQGVVIDGRGFRIEHNVLRLVDPDADWLRTRTGGRRDGVVDGLEPGRPAITARSDGAGELRSNRVIHGGGSAGYVLELNGGVVSGNRGRSSGAGIDSFSVTGDANTISENVVKDAGSRGIVTIGDDNLVRSNAVRGGGGDAFVVQGGRNRIAENTAVGVAAAGLMVTGSQNVLSRNSTDLVGENGIELTSGIGNRLDACSARDCAGAGLLNHARATSVSASVFLRNSQDIETLHEFWELTDTTFETR